MPRFVLLRHECPPDYRDGPHWDLMLERAGRDREHRLATWSLLSLPAAWAVDLGVQNASGGEAVEATRLPDHRVYYLDYEGPVSGDRGRVDRVAGGELIWLTADEQCIEVEFGESPLEGRARLVLITPELWRLSLG